MLQLLLLPILLSNAQESSNRLKTVLPNKATVLVERMPEAANVSVQLFASARGLEESPATHGRRHLLEHLMADDPALDRRLETLGMILKAETYRDAMLLQIDCKTEHVALAIEALVSLTRPRPVDESAIMREVFILAEELALASDARRLSMALWGQAYGDEGLDPLGAHAIMRETSPAALADLWKRQWSADRVVLAVAGGINVAETTRAASAALASLAPAAASDRRLRPAGKAGTATASDAIGEARGALVGSFAEPGTAATLAAALALASEREGAFVTYTPSVENGLIVVGEEGSRPGFGAWVDSLKANDHARLFPVGKDLAERWVKRYLRTPEGTAFLRGYLLVQSPAARPEQLLENIANMTDDAFLSGLSLFGESACVEAVGGTP
jgi:hypothetical protein